MTSTLATKKWTRTEVQAMADAGVLDGQRLELIEGELIDKMGKKRPHVFWNQFLTQWLAAVFGWEFLQRQDPIDVSASEGPWSEPEPDIAVLRRPVVEYSEHPTPADIRLLVEISDSTVDLDLNRKARLYARAEIIEYWVVKVSAREIIVHREPFRGEYRYRRVYLENEYISPLAAPEAQLRILDADPHGLSSFEPE